MAAAATASNVQHLVACSYRRQLEKYSLFANQNKRRHGASDGMVQHLVVVIACVAITTL